MYRTGTESLCRSYSERTAEVFFMSRRKKWRQRQTIVLPLSLFLIAFAIFLSLWWLFAMTVEPNIEEVGRIRAKTMVTKMINKAINDQFLEEADTENLLIRQTNEKGETEMIQADTKAMNLLITEISKELQDEYAKMQEDTVKVPIGALVGSEIFSQTGPSVEVKVLPLSVSGMDFKTEFEAQGINQSKYKVYITINSQVKVMAPASSANLDISSTVLIAEAVILGGVPNSYVQVPKEDILDVTNE